MSFTTQDRRLRALERVGDVTELGPAFLFFPGFQTYEEALAEAGLTDHDGPVFPIRIVGIEPPPRSQVVED